MIYVVGGKGGIRTRQDPLDSVSYRFHNATVAVNAGDAVAPCTPLHAGSTVTERAAGHENKLTNPHAHAQGRQHAEPYERSLDGQTR